MPTAKNTKHLEQGEGRAIGQKVSGSKLDPTGPTGAFAQKSSGSHLDQGEGGALTTRPSGSHLEQGPNLPGTDMTTERGGGTPAGHDRTNPNAGKSKSGSKFAQHPNNTKTKR